MWIFLSMITSKLPLIFLSGSSWKPLNVDTFELLLIEILNILSISFNSVIGWAIILEVKV